MYNVQHMHTEELCFDASIKTSCNRQSDLVASSVLRFNVTIACPQTEYTRLDTYSYLLQTYTNTKKSIPDIKIISHQTSSHLTITAHYYRSITAGQWRPTTVRSCDAVPRQSE